VTEPTATSQKPSVGRVVHYVSYVSYGGEYTRECRAAIVTQVMVLKDLDVPSRRVITTETETCGLAVLNPTGMFFDASVPHNEDTKLGGTWHWPERV
jgi:hypothetical protein